MLLWSRTHLIVGLVIIHDGYGLIWPACSPIVVVDAYVNDVNVVTAIVPRAACRGYTSLLGIISCCSGAFFPSLLLL
jgi:hypothetical protein